jgi:PAS domain S-box-containing protein
VGTDVLPDDQQHSRALAESRFGSQTVVRLRTAFQRSRHPMLLADDQRRCVTGNAAACELLGVAQEELSWHTMDDFTPASERKRFAEQWQVCLTSGTAEGCYELYVPDHGAIPVELSVTANVLPARHLLVLIPHDAAAAAHAESALSHEAGRTPLVPETEDRQQLTSREREVMTLVASGLHNGDVAERLFVSPETVKSHVHNAMGKLGAHTRAHAVAIGLVTAQITWEP